MPSRPSGRSDDSRPVRGSRRRLSLVGSAALVLAITLAGVAMLGSRDALPGDALYGVKRVAESAGLALTFDEVTKAHRHLQLATTRLDEVEQLVAADPSILIEQPELVASAIEQFDDYTGQGVRILLAADDSAGAAEVRETLRSWAAQQLSRLALLKPALPASTGADDALHLLDRVVVRTEALQGQSECEAPIGSVDDLGPVPTCMPDGPAAGGANPDPSVNPSGGPNSTGPAGTPDAGPSVGRSTSPESSRSDTSADPRTRGVPGSSVNPNTSRESPSESDDPGVDIDLPTGDGPDGVLGGGPVSDPEPTSSPVPESSDGEQQTSDGGLPGLPPVEIPPLLPGMPGLSL